jgi:hypothetical protein
MTRTNHLAGRHALAVLAMLQTALFLVPIVVLGRAIDWPSSLRLPAAEVLPLIAREALSVQIGYWAYLLVSLAMVPLALATRTFLNRRGMSGLLVDVSCALGVAGGVLKTLGIVRWLVAMPALSMLHASAPDTATRVAVEVTYVALNGYAGAVGELLGVQLLSGLFLVTTGMALVGIGWRMIGGSAILAGALFVATCARTIVPEMGALQTIAVPLALLWFPAFAIAVWRDRA